jgi:hypothetical protein
MDFDPMTRFPPHSLAMLGDKENIPRPGYVRSGILHAGEWRFEILSDDEKLAVVTIQTVEGPVQIVLDRNQATIVLRDLPLFSATCY